MKVDGLSNKAMRFQVSDENIEVPFASETGVLIQFVEIDGWVRVMIEVGENTTSNDLRTAIPLALNWRDRLLKWQGPRFNGDTALLEQLRMRHKNGESCAKLAENINRRVAEYLGEFVEYIKEYEEAKSSFKTYGDFYTWQSKANPFSLDHARSLLAVFRINKIEIDDLLESGLNNIQIGKSAFDEGYPISRDKMISVLRTWRDSTKHKLLEEQEKIARQERKRGEK